MKHVFIISILLLTIGFIAYGNPTDYDFRQDDRFDNYRDADSELARQIESRLSKIETKLGIAILVGVSLITGLLIPWVRKKIGIGMMVTLVLIGLYGCVATEPVQCAGLRCEHFRCRNHFDCPPACFCDSYYFICRPKF